MSKGYTFIGFMHVLAIVGTLLTVAWTACIGSPPPTASTSNPPPANYHGLTDVSCNNGLIHHKNKPMYNSSGKEIECD